MDLEGVYREQYRPLVTFIHRRIGDWSRAEELAQEVFVRAIRHQPERPRAWIFTVASNLARDEGRRELVRRRHLRLVGSPEVEPAVEAATDTSLEQDEARRRAQKALATLSDTDRRALLMKEDGASYGEIARRLGLSMGSVGTTLCRARKRLVAAWGDAAGERDDVAR